MKKYDLHPKGLPRPMNHQDDTVKHVPVRDASATSREEPLSAYMVAPQYLPRNQRAVLMPKRPLGQPNLPSAASRRPVAPAKEPMKMYNQVGTINPMGSIGSMSRIRRPRQQHIEVTDMDESTAAHESMGKKALGYVSAGAAAIGLGLIFMRDKVVDGWHFVVRKFHDIHFGSRVQYSALSGAASHRFGVRDSWLRVSVPVVLLLFLLGMGLFASLLNKGGSGISGGANGTARNQGGTILQVQQSANKNGGIPTTTGSPQPGSTAAGKTAQAAGGVQSQAAGAAGSLQSGGSAGLGSSGGNGGGGTSSPSGLSGGYGGGSTAPTAAGSPTSTGSGSTGAYGGGGSTAAPASTPDVNASTPASPAVQLPISSPIQNTDTVTVPSNTVTDTAGKTVVGTSPTTLTVN